jgi:hypothetical protein
MGHVTADFSPDPRSDLSAIIRAGLGHEVDERTFEALADMQERLRGRQRDLVQSLMSGNVSREQYIAELRVVLKDAEQDGTRLLGADGFHKVFGDFSVEQMVDLSAFLEKDR